MSSKAKPLFSPPSPGETLKRYILGDGASTGRITQDELAKAIGLSRLSVNELINGKRAINAKTALKLSHVLGTTPEFWMNLQLGADIFKAKLELSRELKKMPVLRVTVAAK
jgi:addiction module HigA family antidote